MKTAVLTGANGAMGVHITKALLSAGYSLWMVCKPEPLADAFLQEMKTAFPDASIEVVEADLASLASLRNMVATLKQKIGHLDLLINNAGILTPFIFTGTDGYDIHWTINYLAPVFICENLSCLLSEGSRVINTVSCSMYIGRLKDERPFEDLTDKKARRIQKYSDAKLGLLHYSLFLADEWKARGIAVCCSDPGIVDTPLISMHNGVDFFSDLLFRPLIKKPEEGARTAITLALEEETPASGLYFNNKKRRISGYLMNRKYAGGLCVQTRKWIHENS